MNELEFEVMGMKIKVSFIKQDDLVVMRIASLMGIKEQTFKKEELKKQFQDTLKWLDE